MIWMEVVIPKSDPATKNQLLSAISREFVEATGFEDEKLYVRFSEFGSDDLGEADAFTGASAAHAILYCPRLRFDVKRSLASGLNNAFASAQLNALIHIMEFPYENIATSGSLLTDADEELASRPFYYVIPH